MFQTDGTPDILPVGVFPVGQTAHGCDRNRRLSSPSRCGKLRNPVRIGPDDSPRGSLYSWQRQLENDCLQCHTTETWNEVTFEHDTAQFHLKGKHNEVECEQCHLLETIEVSSNQARADSADKNTTFRR